MPWKSENFYPLEWIAYGLTEGDRVLVDKFGPFTVTHRTTHTSDFGLRGASNRYQIRFLDDKYWMIFRPGTGRVIMCDRDDWNDTYDCPAPDVTSQKVVRCIRKASESKHNS